MSNLRPDFVSVIGNSLTDVLQGMEKRPAGSIGAARARDAAQEIHRGISTVASGRLWMWSTSW